MSFTGASVRPSRWLALVVLCAGMLMIVLDQTVVNVALPSIQRDLGFSQSSLAWVVNAYLIPFGGLLLLAGRLGDLVGRKRILITGLLVFTLASLVCGLSNSQPLLVGAVSYRLASCLSGSSWPLRSCVAKLGTTCSWSTSRQTLRTTNTPRDVSVLSIWRFRS